MAQKTKTINTKLGKIKGLVINDCLQFRGIRYATANRWEYPTQTGKFSGTYDATQFGACSYQRRGFEDDAECNKFYHKEFRQGLEFKYSEDCFFLNIWAPQDCENAPVLVYIHGGSFTGGSTDEGHISGEAYAKEGIIFVAMNYRLGPYGFCSHPDLTDDEGRCGNFGLYDQLTALNWVHDNIADFGGNPNEITILGQSAGAMSVDIHISSPLKSFEYSGAVMMSGAALQRAVARPLTPEKTRGFWDKIIENASCSSIEEMRTIGERELFYAWLKACQDDFKSMLYTLPVVDGQLVTKESFNMSTIPDIPIIVGVTSSDMVPIALEGLAKSYVSKCDQHVHPCYVYNFNRDLPGDDNGAWHSCDLLYAFGTLQNNYRPFTEVDYEISHQMIKSFSAFVKTGNPNCNAIDWWLGGSSNLPLRFCEETASKNWDSKKLLKNTLFNKGPM